MDFSLESNPSSRMMLRDFISLWCFALLLQNRRIQELFERDPKYFATLERDLHRAGTTSERAVLLDKYVINSQRGCWFGGGKRDEPQRRIERIYGVKYNLACPHKLRAQADALREVLRRYEAAHRAYAGNSADADALLEAARIVHAKAERLAPTPADDPLSYARQQLGVAIHAAASPYARMAHRFKVTRVALLKEADDRFGCAS